MKLNGKYGFLITGSLVIELKYDYAVVRKGFIPCGIRRQEFTLTRTEWILRAVKSTLVRGYQIDCVNGNDQLNLSPSKERLWPITPELLDELL